MTRRRPLISRPFAISSAVYAVTGLGNFIGKLNASYKKEKVAQIAKVETQFMVIEGNASLIAMYNAQAQHGTLQKSQCDIADVISRLSTKDIQKAQRYVEILATFKQVSTTELGAYKARVARVVNAINKSNELTVACRKIYAATVVEVSDADRVYEWYEKPEISFNYPQ